MAPPHYDCLVLGGGPAGSVFALQAARAGARVLLVERGDHDAPRPGEHLSGDIRPELDRIGVAFPDGNGIATSSPGILSLWNGVPVARPYAASGEAEAICVVRNRFDALLFDSARRAGAVPLKGARLAVADRAANGWHVSLALGKGRQQSLTAVTIVDATGRRSAFARSQGSRRLRYGDLFAIVGWLESSDPTAQRERTMLLVEACPLGWWSLSTDIDGRAIATHYTSLSVLKASRLTPRDFFRLALAAAPGLRRMLSSQQFSHIATAMFPAFPARASAMAGKGWIAIGEAAAALDPVGGQGVSFAVQTACRAFEAVRADAALSRLGEAYRDAVLARVARHLEGRANVYAEAGAMHPEIARRICVNALST